MTPFHFITRLCARSPSRRLCRRLCSLKDEGPGPSGDGPCGPCAFYDSRKYGTELPGNCVETPFEPLPGIPTGVFRCTTNEILGPYAGKHSYYRNPEYFSFHHMSFYDLHMALCRCRQPPLKTGRKAI